MNEITHRHLSEKWFTQQDRLRERNENFEKAALALTTHIATALDAADKTYLDTETGQPVPYISFGLNETDPDQQAYLSESGLFVFVLQIIVDKGAETYPKTSLQFPVALKYDRQNIYYGCWDKDDLELAEGTNWILGEAEFADFLLHKIDELLSYDPMEGVQSQNPIGFIIN